MSISNWLLWRISFERNETMQHQFNLNAHAFQLWRTKEKSVCEAKEIFYLNFLLNSSVDAVLMTTIQMGECERPTIKCVFDLIKINVCESDWLQRQSAKACYYYHYVYLDRLWGWFLSIWIFFIQSIFVFISDYFQQLVIWSRGETKILAVDLLKVFVWIFVGVEITHTAHLIRKQLLNFSFGIKNIGRLIDKMARGEQKVRM